MKAGLTVDNIQIDGKQYPVSDVEIEYPEQIADMAEDIDSLGRSMVEISIRVTDYCLPGLKVFYKSLEQVEKRVKRVQKFLKRNHHLLSRRK